MFAAILHTDLHRKRNKKVRPTSSIESGDSFNFMKFVLLFVNKISFSFALSCLEKKRIN